MNTANLRINQLAEDDFRWYLRCVAAIDARDIEAYAAFLADSCTMQFNNNPVVTGKAGILSALGGYWQSYAGLEHELLNIYGSGRAFMLEALNHYTRHDGKKVTLRAVALTDREDEGLVTAVRVYSDTAPLFG